VKIKGVFRLDVDLGKENCKRDERELGLEKQPGKIAPR